MPKTPSPMDANGSADAILGGGLTVLDGAALVAGAAVASVHARGVIREDLTEGAWILVWGTLAWVAVTSSGPFVYVVRGWLRRVPGHPLIGDRLWAWLGLPWLATTALQGPPGEKGGPTNILFTAGLGVGLGIACLAAAWVVWTRWVAVSPEEAAERFAPPWTNRVGLILAIAWPLQCAAALVVVG